MFFYGGTGKQDHNSLIKDTDNHTQQQITIFTPQCAQRYHENMIVKTISKVFSQFNSLKYILQESRDIQLERWTKSHKATMTEVGPRSEVTAM